MCMLYINKYVLEFARGSGGLSPQEQKKFKKKSNKMEAFPLFFLFFFFFLLFGRAP